MPPLHPRPLPPPGIRAPRPGSASLAGRRRGPPRPPPGWPASDRARRAPSRCWGAAASWARTCPVSPRLRVAGDRWAGVTASTRGLRANTPPPHEGLERLPRPPTPRVTVTCTDPAHAPRGWGTARGMWEAGTGGRRRWKGARGAPPGRGICGEAEGPVGAGRGGVGDGPSRKQAHRPPAAAASRRHRRLITHGASRELLGSGRVPSAGHAGGTAKEGGWPSVWNGR